LLNLQHVLIHNRVVSLKNPLDYKIVKKTLKYWLLVCLVFSAHAGDDEHVRRHPPAALAAVSGTTSDTSKLPTFSFSTPIPVGNTGKTVKITEKYVPYSAAFALEEKYKTREKDLLDQLANANHELKILRSLRLPRNNNADHPLVREQQHTANSDIVNKWIMRHCCFQERLKVQKQSQDVQQ